MLIKRTLWVVLLMLVGLAVTAISLWSLAFSQTASDTPAFSGTWILERLPVLVGIVILVAGFRLLGSTPTRQPSPDADDPAP
ncbi:MAG: hypothetical protein INR65_08180 [Gluconacetobacter diazotrophicus]|nr:hypothetical protein [Gluconacetobacter diazotrophicus]